MSRIFHGALTIGDSNIGADIPLPLSSAIARALKPPRGHADKSDPIFPGCEQAGRHELALPRNGRGHALRRTFKIAAGARSNFPAPSTAR
jgi:hypothetical protein